MNRHKSELIQENLRNTRQKKTQQKHSITHQVCVALSVTQFTRKWDRSVWFDFFIMFPKWQHQPAGTDSASLLRKSESRQCIPTAERTPPSAREPSGEIGVVAPLNSNLGGAGASPGRKHLSLRLYLHVHIDMTDRRASHIDYLGQRAAYEYAASECF